MPPTTSNNVEVDGSITLKIANQPFTLAGKLSKITVNNVAKSAIVVAYHREFADAASLGSVTSIAAEVAGAFGVSGVKDQVDTAIGDLQAIPMFGDFVDKIANANIRITDLGINTVTNVYQFGFGLDFTENPLTIGGDQGLVLEAVGLRVTYTKPAV